MPEILLNKETFEGLNSRFNTAFSRAEEAAQCALNAETVHGVPKLSVAILSKITNSGNDISSVMQTIVNSFTETDNELSKKSQEIGEQFVGQAFSSLVTEFRKADTTEDKSIKEVAEDLLKEGYYFDPN